MAEYIDKADALNVDFQIKCSLFESRIKTAQRAVEAYADAISAIPAQDVRRVVFCRECIHLSNETNGGAFFRCDRYDKWQAKDQRVYMPLDGFCSYGQRETS